jgi:hypothetical protein
LGVPDRSKDLSFPSITIREYKTNADYQIFLLPHNSSYIIARGDGQEVREFKLDSNFGLRSAIIVGIVAVLPVVMPISDAIRLYNVDLKFWASVADNFDSP